MPYELHVLHEGYSHIVNADVMAGNCTSTLLKGQYNIIIDTMTPWDKDIITAGLQRHDVRCEDIDFVICTHGHSDHIGNNNLFLNAKQHIVGFSISHRDQYTFHPFQAGVAYEIDKDVSVLPTPGHTCDDVSAIVNTKQYGLVAIAGDLFERKEDLDDASLWRDIGGSQFPEKQEEHRNKVLAMVDYIVPGHGPMFKVPAQVKSKLKQS